MHTEAIVAYFKVLSQDLSMCWSAQSKFSCTEFDLSEATTLASPCSVVTFWMVNHVLCSTSGPCCFCYLFQNENT